MFAVRRSKQSARINRVYSSNSHYILALQIEAVRKGSAWIEKVWAFIAQNNIVHSLLAECKIGELRRNAITWSKAYWLKLNYLGE